MIDEQGWTIETLRQHYDARLQEMDLRYQQRFDAQQQALQAALLAAEKAVQTALIAVEKSSAKTELAAEERFKLLNELRTGVATASQLEALKEVVAAIAKRVDQSTGGRTALLSAVSVIAAIVAIFITLR